MCAFKTLTLKTCYLVLWNLYFVFLFPFCIYLQDESKVPVLPYALYASFTAYEK